MTGSLYIVRDFDGNLRLFKGKPYITFDKEKFFNGKYDYDNPYGKGIEVYEETGEEHKVFMSSFSAYPKEGIIVDDNNFSEKIKSIKEGDIFKLN